MSAIDSRSAAFLQEMGIAPLWTLRGVPEAAPAEAPPQLETPVGYSEAHLPASSPPPSVPYSAAHLPDRAPTPVVDSAWGDEPPAPPASDAEIAAMDWTQLKAAIASCTRCDLCKGRKPVYGTGALKATWLVAAGATTAADEKERQPVAGDAGKLLVNMLAAVDLARDTQVYTTNLIKCRPVSANGGDRAPTLDEAKACRPYLERELALTGAGMVLTLGQIAANALQGKPLQEPLAGSRGQVHEINGVKLVATLHPGELLRRGADKALAWADLCLARANDGRGG
jgi:uracil-DNA glycosylase family 4